MLSTLSYILSVSGDSAAAGAVAGVGALMIVFWAIAIIGTIFVVWMLIDCLTSSLPTNEKILWTLVIIFLHLLGALIYFFVKRSGTHNPRLTA